LGLPMNLAGIPSAIQSCVSSPYVRSWYTLRPDSFNISIWMMIGLY